MHALKLSEKLRSLGVDITLHSLAKADDPKGLRGYFRKVDVPFEIYGYEWHPDLVTRLERMIESYASNLPRDCDIYHAQDCVGGTALARMRAKGLLKAPIFRTIHHVDDFAAPRLLEFEKKAVSSAEHRFVVSQYWKKALKQEFGYDSIVTYNGLDLEDFAGLPKRKSKVPTVLFVGGLEPRKGLEYLVHAMELVIDEIPSARLIAVAKTGFRGTDEWGWFETLADRLGIAGNVEFFESVSQKKLLGFYAESDLLVLPSKTEGWGLALMEAMACGRPVVASRVGGVPELVRDGIDGILVASSDVRALAGAITKLLKDAKLRERMGKAGRGRVKGFSWDNSAKTVLAAYESALHRA